MIKIWFLIPLLFCLVQDETPKEFEIKALEKTRIKMFENNVLFWSYLDDTSKFQAVIDMSNLSDGALNFQIHSDITNEDSVFNDISESILRIVYCMDTEGFKYYTEFKNDIDIGTILIVCMSKDGMMN